MPTRVMIVEDEAFVATDMCDALEDYGYDCAGIADDTASAMQLASKNVEIALVDVNLCDGKTGPMIGELLSRDHGIKVIFITANPDQLGDGIPGTLGVVSKPVDYTMIDNVLRYALSATAKSASTPAPPPGFVPFRART